MNVQVCLERDGENKNTGKPRDAPVEAGTEDKKKNSIDGTKMTRESGTRGHGSSGGMGGDRGAKEREGEIQR